MDLGLEGKVAAVAGGSAGLGFAVARELALEGAHVAICGRDADRLEAARARLAALAPGRILASRVDLSRAGAPGGWIAEVAGRLGGLQIAVTNGGAPPFGRASDFALEDYRHAMAGTFFPAVDIALAALPLLRASGWGRLLLITSETVSAPVSRLALSGAARIGLVRFAQSLAAELGREGITVNVLAPGVTRTPGLERAATRLAQVRSAEARSAQVRSAEARSAEPHPALAAGVEVELRAMGEGNALGRPARAEEFGAVAAFLASERASFVTGTVQVVDGGAQVVAHEHGYLGASDRNTYP